MRYRAFAGLLFGALASAIMGCSENKTATVSGTVTVDGQPAEKGSISFNSVDGKTPPGGGTIENGKYTATQVPIGPTTVDIRVPKVTGKKKLYDTPDSPVRETFSESLPAKYNTKSELKFEAKPGSNQKDWELSAK